MIDKETWVRERAYHLSDCAGHPPGHELDFWLQAEREYKDSHICILCLGQCPFQEEQPLNGGRHIAICTIDDIKKCRYRANCYKLPILTASVPNHEVTNGETNGRTEAAACGT